MSDLARRALVTGGASGLGLDIARRLHADGAAVAVLDRSQAALESLRTTDPGLHGWAGDVREPHQVRVAMDAAAATFDGLDTLIVSAGVIRIGPLAEVTEADWDLTLDVNLKGAFLAMQAAAPYLVASGRGRIVAIASDAGRRGFAGIAAYCASKFGLIGLVESLAVELAEHQVTVNAVCPVGTPTTGMGRQVLDWKVRATGQAADAVLAAAARGNPLGRNATETDIVTAVMFLVSDGAAFLTGLSLDVDGGAHLGFLPGV